jgi:hypothetical protein
MCRITRSTKNHPTLMRQTIPNYTSLVQLVSHQWSPSTLALPTTARRCDMLARQLKLREGLPKPELSCMHICLQGCNWSKRLRGGKAPCLWFHGSWHKIVSWWCTTSQHKASVGGINPLADHGTHQCVPCLTILCECVPLTA